MRFIGFIFLALLIGCQTSPTWVARDLNTHLPEHDSRRLFHETDNPSGIDIAVYQLKNSSHIYLQTHGNGFKTDPKNPKQVLVKLSTETSIYQGIAFCHQGKQRAVLSEGLKEIFFDLLKQNQKIQIEAGGYRESIDPKGFHLTKKFSLLPNFVLF